mgnify:CR=1 FL=1
MITVGLKALPMSEATDSNQLLRYYRRYIGDPDRAVDVYAGFGLFFLGLGLGVAGILIMSCGEECPYEGAYHALAKRIDAVYKEMKAADIDIRRLRLTAICTVCNRAFLREINQMNEVVQELL